MKKFFAPHQELNFFFLNWVGEISSTVQNVCDLYVRFLMELEISSDRVLGKTLSTAKI
jgi:hypothetical protein